MIKFKRYKKTAIAEMVQVTKENIIEIQELVLKTSIEPIFTYDEKGYKIGNLESKGYFADYGSYLVREILDNGKINYYPINEKIQNKNYEEVQ